MKKMTAVILCVVLCLSRVLASAHGWSFCPNCGTRLETFYSFCPGCSFNLNGGDTDPAPQPAKKWPVGSECVILASPAGAARSGPGVGYAQVGFVCNGSWFEILDCQLGDTGRDWYEIILNGKHCWISSGIVEVDGHRDGTVNRVPQD